LETAKAQHFCRRCSAQFERLMLLWQMRALRLVVSLQRIDAVETQLRASRTIGSNVFADSPPCIPGVGIKPNGIAIGGCVHYSELTLNER
jgi:hypothetical protein